MSTWYERLKKVREKNELTQPELGSKIGIDATSISRYEKGKGAINIPYQLKQKLTKVFTLKEIEYIENGTSITVSQNVVGNGNVQQSGSGNSVSGMSATSKECTVEIPDESDMVDIPFLHDVFASAGGGATIPNEVDSGVIKFSTSFLKDFLRIDRFKGIHLITATGNSMEPTIVPGELLMVNPYENEDCRIKDGAIYIIICSDSVYVKRVYPSPKEMKLVSDNKDVDDIIIRSDDMDGCKIIGRVVGHFDKL